MLSETSRLAHLLFDRAMTDAQRDMFLPKFLDDDRFHLAFAGTETDTRSRRELSSSRRAGSGGDKSPRSKSGSDFIVNGVKHGVANAPIAGLFAVLVDIPGKGAGGAAGAGGHAGRERARARQAWHHGACGDVTFKDCKVPAGNLLADDAAALLTGADAAGRGIPLVQAINLGIGRAAYEAALDYAHLRVQGGRPIIEHQAIATKLAEIAIRLEVARAAVWQAAWASDHPEAIADRSLSDLPLTTMAQVFVSETLLKATKDAAEVFGAMGVMRDMPLQKYVHDARVCLHTGDGNSDAKLRIAEALAGYRRAISGAMAPAANSKISGEERSHGLQSEQRTALLADGGAQIRRGGDPPDLARTRRHPDRGRDLRLGHHQEGLEARLPHAGGAEGMGRPRHRLRDAGAGDGRARQGRQRDLESVQPELEMEPPDLGDLHGRAEGALPQPFVADDTFVLGKGITEPSAGSDNRLPPDDIKAGLKLKAERKGDEWILNGEKAFIANAPIGKLFFIDARTDHTVPLKQGTTMFLVPRDTPGFRIGKVFNKSGWRFYQNGEMIFENARVPHANVVGDVGGAVRKTGGRGGDTTGGDIFGDLELCANALGICDDACETAMRYAKTTKQGGQVAVRAAERPAPDQQDVHADRGAALVRDARRLGARHEDPLLQRRPGDELFDRRGAGSDRALHGRARRRRAA